jgi:hypothetical protein
MVLDIDPMEIADSARVIEGPLGAAPLTKNSIT